MRPIVVIGSINTDLVARVPRLPAPGETITGSALLTLAGGKGANQAVAVARLGARVHLVGRVGDDAFGRQLLAGLRRERVGTTHVRVTPGVASGCALILVDRRGENAIVVSPGANARVGFADVDAAIPLIRSAAVVLLQLEIPLATVRHALALCRRLGVPTVLDPAPVPPRGLPPALYRADILTPNQLESLQLVRRKGTDPKRIAADLLSRGAGTVILKLGARGALLAPRDSSPCLIPPFRVKVVDSTAAGDAFNAALAVAMAEGKSMAQAVRFANAAGAVCCTTLGAQPALPARPAINQRVRSATFNR